MGDVPRTPDESTQGAETIKVLRFTGGGGGAGGGTLFFARSCDVARKRQEVCQAIAIETLWARETTLGLD